MITRSKQPGRFNALYNAALNLGMADRDARHYAAEALKTEALQQATERVKWSAP